MCDEKLPFFALAQALSQRKLNHTGLQIEANSTSLVLKLLTLPMPEVKPADNKVHFNKNEYIFRNESKTKILCLHRSPFQRSIQPFGMLC